MSDRAVLFTIIVLSVGVGLSSAPCAAGQMPHETPRLLASVASTGNGRAQESPIYSAKPPETLRGLRGVMVVVEDLAPDLEEHGLKWNSVKRQVELRLQTAHIPLLTNRECFDSPGRPYLYLDMSTHNTGAGIYGYSIRLELNQETLLERDPTLKATATTWVTSRVGVVGARYLPTLSEEAISLVDEFIATYRAANGD